MINPQKNLVLVNYLFYENFLGDIDYLKSLLNAQEIERVSQFKYSIDKLKFIIGRSMLKILIGKFLKTNPVFINLEYTFYGKPYLPDSDLRFNISHSGDIVVFCFSKNFEVGIDVEFMKPLEERNSIALSYFSDTEFEEFRNVLIEDKLEAFYNCWTRKEAFIKAIGEGLSYPLKNFDVSVKLDEKVKIKNIKNLDLNNWCLKDVPIDESYKCSLAANTNKVILEIEFIETLEKSLIYISKI